MSIQSTVKEYLEILNEKTFEYKVTIMDLGIKLRVSGTGTDQKFKTYSDFYNKFMPQRFRDKNIRYSKDVLKQYFMEPDEMKSKNVMKLLGFTLL